MQQKIKPRIVISGASGFIGSALVQSFIDAGHEVVGLVRNPEKMPSNQVKYVTYSFEKEIVPEVFMSGDVFIHCAYSSDSTTTDKSILSTQRLIQQAKNKGNVQCLFISSIAATSSSGSKYAYEKKTLEAAFQSNIDIILRPGLVIGKGGLFYKTFLFMKQKGILPIFGKGKQLVHYIALQDLLAIIHYLIVHQKAGIYYAVNGNPLTYIDFYSQVGKHTDRKVRMIHLPFWIVKFAVSTFGKIIQLPITTDSIKGLQQIPNLDKSILEKSNFPIQLKDINEILNDIKG
jgi:nucleoside-diphosphate-sugar epimerase